MKQKNLKNNTNSNIVHSGIGNNGKARTLVYITEKKPKQNKINNISINIYISILLIFCIMDIWNPNFVLTSYNYLAAYVTENVSIYVYLSTDLSFIESVYILFGDHLVDKMDLANLQKLSDSDTNVPELTDESTIGDSSEPSTPGPYDDLPEWESATEPMNTDGIREYVDDLLGEARAHENETNGGLLQEAESLAEEIHADLDQTDEEETESCEGSEETESYDELEDTSDDANQQADSSNDTNQNADSSNYVNQNIGTSHNAIINLYGKNDKKCVKLNMSSPSKHKTLTTSYYSTLTPESFYKNTKRRNLKLLDMKIKHVLQAINTTTQCSKANSNTLNNIYINLVNKIKHSPPAVKEWINSAYLYNKTHKNFPILDRILSRSIRSHFNLYSSKLRKKIRKHGSRRFEIRKSRRLMNKIFIGKPELKHSNDNINVTVYVYNAEKKYLINKVNKIPAIYKTNTVNKLSPSTYKNNKAKILYLNKTKRASFSIKSRLVNYKNKFFILKKIKTKKHVSTNKYQKNFFKTYVRKFLRKEIISNNYKQILIFNRQKFEKRYIIHLASNIAKIYKKKIEFNFINLKHLYLDSQIFSISLVTKLKRLAKKKKSFLIGLKRFLNMFKIPRINSLHIYNEMFNRQMVNQSVSNNNISIIPSQIDTMHDDYVNADIIDNTLKYENYITRSINNFKNSNITGYVSTITKGFNSLKYKIINGVRLEVAGRFTKRSSAARSVFKIRNKGSIKNKDSSYKGLPAIILKGYAKCNLQFNKVFSKVRGGSFGIKSSLSGA